MSQSAGFFGGKKAGVEFDPEPGEINRMPERPYRVLHAGIPFYSDSKCEEQVQEATLVILRCEDPRQNHLPIECMPTRLRYEAGQIVNWDLNNKKLWELSWYVDPETGKIERAWIQAVEFIGKVVRAEGSPEAISS